jgi:hypothetical protein
MSSKSKSTKKSSVQYYGCVYGGVMKQGYVYFFKTTDDPDEYFSQFQSYYGNKVRGRYVKVADEEDYLEKLEEKLSDHKVHGSLYEVSVDTASKTLKELTGAKKTSLLGEDDHAEEKAAKTEADDEGTTEKKVKAKSKKEETPKETQKEEAKPAKASSKKSKAVESEAEDSDDEQPSEAESESDNEEEVKETKKPAKAVVKETSEKSKPKKETKAKSSK